MSEDANPFRDIDDATESPSTAATRPHDPYRSPSAASVDPDRSREEDRRWIRIAPGTLLLIGYAPYFVAFWAMAATWERYYALDEFFFRTSRVLLLESCAFAGRTFWFGPGPAFVRVPTILLLAIAAALHLTWFAPMTGEVEIFVNPTIAAGVIEYLVVTAAAAATSALFFAIGSRDVRIEGDRRGRLETGDLVAALLAISLVGVGAIPPIAWQVGLSDPFPSDSFDIADYVVRPAILAGMATCALLVWRLGVRGLRELRSWAGFRFAVGAFLLGMILVAMTLAALAGNVPWEILAAFAIGAFLVPIGREFLFRLAGYRAVNIYAERRRERREAARSR